MGGQSLTSHPLGRPLVQQHIGQLESRTLSRAKTNDCDDYAAPGVHTQIKETSTLLNHTRATIMTPLFGAALVLLFVLLFVCCVCGGGGRILPAVDRPRTCPVLLML